MACVFLMGNHNRNDGNMMNKTEDTGLKQGLYSGVSLKEVSIVSIHFNHISNALFIK